MPPGDENDRSIRGAGPQRCRTQSSQGSRGRSHSCEVLPAPQHREDVACPRSAVEGGRLPPAKLAMGHRAAGSCPLGGKRFLCRRRDGRFLPDGGGPLKKDFLSMLDAKDEVLI